MFMERLHALTGRNIIAYYSGWQQKQELSKQGFQGFGIDDLDMNSFMSVVHGLDRSKGLDLILHTPGGDVVATEAIVNYLKQLFDGDIRTIIPQMAMSAGTLVCLSAKEIIMGRQSSLGPIDPQIAGLAAESILAEFEEAKEAITANPDTYLVYKSRLESYHPTLIIECENAVKLAKELAKDYLLDCMLKGKTDKETIADTIVGHFSSHGQTKTHGRHISGVHAKSLGLNIVELETIEPVDKKETEESDAVPGFQDTLLSIHHAFILTLGETNAVKIVQNHEGKSSIASVNLRQA